MANLNKILEDLMRLLDPRLSSAHSLFDFDQLAEFQVRSRLAIENASHS
jgi:hypothetical protein